MRCNAMLFNLDRVNSTRKPGQVNNFLTFVDIDTGESFRTFVNEATASKFQKMKQVEIELSISVGEYNGQSQLNCRIIEIRDIALESKPSSVNFGKIGTNV